MDLTPKPSTPWWSIFDCCRPPSASSSVASDDDVDREDTTTTTTLKVATDKGVVGDVDGLPETPATECTNLSVADVSFESDVEFIGDISASTPKSSPSREKVVTFEGEDSFIGELAVSTPQKAALDEMSDPDEYWYADTNGLDKNQSPLRPSASNSHTQNTNNTQEKAEEEEEDLHVVPEIGSTNTTNNYQKPIDKSVQDQMEVKFYQFMLLMMIRHLFGSWLPGEVNPFTNMFQNKLLTGGGSKSEKKEFRKMMTLRKLDYKDNKCEVVPQLKPPRTPPGAQIPVIDEYGRVNDGN